MNALGRGATHRAAWDWLFEELGADLALVQDGVLPADLPGSAVGGTLEHRSKRYGWGSWVVAAEGSGIELQAIPRAEGSDIWVLPPALADSHPGATAVANVVIDGAVQFVAVSMYGVMDNTGGGRTRHATTSLHRMLSDLMPVSEARVPVVLAGDLNVTTQPMKGDPGGWWHDQHRSLFARIEGLGMVDAARLPGFVATPSKGCTCAEDPCTHFRTIRHMNDPASTPYEIDWAFVSKALARRIRSGRVVDTDDAWSRSDHCPIEVVLDA